MSASSSHPGLVAVDAVPARDVELSHDMELVERCRERDHAAWRDLYELHFDFAYRTARRLGIPDHELEDVVQEAFLVVHRRMDDFRSGRFTTWLFRIVANIASARHRRRRVREWWHGLWSIEEPELSFTTDAHLSSKEAQAQVARVLARMAPKKRDVFVLFELEGLSGEEIAERVGCKVNTVWTRLYHARRDFERLARALGDKEGR